MVRIKIGCRVSQLALAYAEKVKNKLLTAVPDADITLVGIKSDGDIHPDVDISKIGGKGVFCKLIEQELFWGNIDIAVHSLKDMPGEENPALCVHVDGARGQAHGTPRPRPPDRAVQFQTVRFRWVRLIPVNSREFLVIPANSR